MRIVKKTTTYAQVDLIVNKFAIVPKWVFDYDSCLRCNINFDDSIYIDDCVVRILDQFNEYHSFCIDCWKQVYVKQT